LWKQEGQLVLLLPQLPFNTQTKGGKTYNFFLSSEYEKTQWIEAIGVLQQTITSGQTDSSNSSHININELQAWIETCRKGLNPNLGSFLLRSIKDEDLLHGDLYLEINSLKGLSRPAGK
jgi:breakpoint cluster region protein